MNRRLRVGRLVARRRIFHRWYIVLTLCYLGSAMVGLIVGSIVDRRGGAPLGPSIVGVLRDRWGGYEGALYVLAAIDAGAMVLIMCGRGLRT